MDPITLAVHPQAGHPSEYTLEVAAAISEAVRVLNYASLPQNAAAGLPYPATVYDVIGRLQTATAGMDQLANQLAGRLVEIATEHEVTVEFGRFEGDPVTAMGNALEALDAVRQAATALDGALRNAHNALSPIGVRIPDDDPDDD